MKLPAITCLATALFCLTGCDVVKQRPRPLAVWATLDIYEATSVPTAGAQEFTDPDTQEPVYLVLPAILSAADVETVQRMEDDPQGPSLMINLTPGGRRKLASATANPNGRRLAFVIHGKLMATPEVVTPINSAGVRITGGSWGQGFDKTFAELVGE